MTCRRLGVVGLGGMGAGMAHALLDAGFPVTVHNRTAAKTEPLLRAGAQVADSAGAVGAAGDVLLLSLSDEPAIEQVLFGELVERLQPGTTVIDTSTVSPCCARDTAARLAASGIRRVEACVLGNPDMARAGRLRVFAAGEPAAVQQVDDVLSAISQQVRYVGPAGQASVLKLAFNLLLGVQTAGLGEAVALAEAAGLDRALLFDALEDSGWRSPVLSFRAEFMRRRTYRPAGFRSALMHKDLRLAQEEAAARGAALPLTGCAGDRFALLVATGQGDQDAAAVAELRSETVLGAAVLDGGSRAEQTAELTVLTEAGSAFCSAKLLLSALELGVFTALHDAPAGEPELRERLGLHPRACRDFLDALVALGLLRRTGERYRNSAAADRHLVRGPGYGGGFLEGASHVLYPVWGQLTRALRTGEPQADGDLAQLLTDPLRRRGYLAMMDSLSDPLVDDVARVLDWSRYRTLADIGGARGNLVARLLQRHDHLNAVVFDLPPNAEPCAEHVQELGVADRVRFRGGDFFADALPEADVLIVGHVLADFALADRRSLIAKAFRAIRPGGAVLVYDPMPDEHQPELASLVASLHMLLMTPAGSGYPARQCREWLGHAGFREISTHPSQLGNHVLIGHKAG